MAGNRGELAARKQDGSGQDLSTSEAAKLKGQTNGQTSGPRGQLLLPKFPTIPIELTLNVICKMVHRIQLHFK